MVLDWTAEVERLAILSRLALSQEEVVSLAERCEAITREFSDLARYTSDLPDAPDAGFGSLREDAASAAPSDEIEAILSAAPRRDPTSREVLVPRGSS